MIYVYFSYRDDAAILRHSIASLRAQDPTATIWLANDAAAPIPDSEIPPAVKILHTHYKRGGTGTGLENLRGQLSTFRHILAAEKTDHLIKIDSDIFVNRHWCGFEPGKNGFCPVEADMLAFEGARALLPMGGIYRISRHAVRYCEQYLQQRQHWQPGTYAEALTLWHILATSPLRLCLFPSPHHILDGFSLSNLRPGACYIHTGEPYPQNTTLHRPDRELTLTRMLLLRGGGKKK